MNETHKDTKGEIEYPYKWYIKKIFMWFTISAVGIILIGVIQRIILGISVFSGW